MKSNNLLSILEHVLFSMSLNKLWIESEGLIFCHQFLHLKIPLEVLFATMQDMAHLFSIKTVLESLF